MNYGQIIHQLEQELSPFGEDKESLLYAFRELKGWNQTDLVLNLSKEVEAADNRLLIEIAEQLKTHTPAQYIAKTAYFRELALKVDDRVLIPRPETEELVQLIIEENTDEKLDVLDIGTGSGAIALALAKVKKNWRLTASDISRDALELARENAEKNQVQLNLIQSDLFRNISGKFDIIVSNPPYISYKDKDEVDQNVFRHEPHLALFADEDGFAIYRHIAQSANSYLTEGGKLYLEIGYKQGDVLKQLFEQAFPNRRVRVLKDSFDKERMVVVDYG